MNEYGDEEEVLTLDQFIPKRQKRGAPLTKHVAMDGDTHARMVALSEQLNTTLTDTLATVMAYIEYLTTE